MQTKNLIKEIIEKTGIKVIEVAEADDKGSTWYNVEVSEPHFFISRDGEALHALNHLVRRITETAEVEPNFLIDINGFQKKRVDSVRAIAHMMAERARYFKSNIEIDPMSAFERRIVHEFLAEATDLKTESSGVGPTRRVVIKYIGSS